MLVLVLVLVVVLVLVLVLVDVAGTVDVLEVVAPTVTLNSAEADRPLGFPSAMTG